MITNLRYWLNELIEILPSVDRIQVIRGLNTIKIWDWVINNWVESNSNSSIYDIALRQEAYECFFVFWWLISPNKRVGQLKQQLRHQSSIAPLDLKLEHMRCSHRFKISTCLEFMEYITWLDLLLFYWKKKNLWARRIEDDGSRERFVGRWGRSTTKKSQIYRVKSLGMFMTCC